MRCNGKRGHSAQVQYTQGRLMNRGTSREMEKFQTYRKGLMAQKKAPQNVNVCRACLRA